LFEEIQNCLKRYKIPFIETPVQTTVPEEREFSEEEFTKVELEI